MDKPTEYRQGDGCVRNSDGTYQPVAVGGTNPPPTDKYVDHAKALRDYETDK